MCNIFDFNLFSTYHPLYLRLFKKLLNKKTSFIIQWPNLLLATLRKDSERHDDIRYKDLRYKDVRYKDIRYKDIRYKDIRYKDIRYKEPIVKSNFL